mmetsp:Transcript_46317/g.128893  ORF Transcript_46317/g.128893 Transcript_46317/m.128893 type:complete len:338 (-) Transcript_46317:1428-2441(-)
MKLDMKLASLSALFSFCGSFKDFLSVIPPLFFFGTTAMCGASPPPGRSVVTGRLGLLVQVRALLGSWRGLAMEAIATSSVGDCARTTSIERVLLTLSTSLSKLSFKSSENNEGGCTKKDSSSSGSSAKTSSASPRTSFGNVASELWLLMVASTWPLARKAFGPIASESWPLEVMSTASRECSDGIVDWYVDVRIFAARNSTPMTRCSKSRSRRAVRSSDIFHMDASRCKCSMTRSDPEVKCCVMRKTSPSCSVAVVFRRVSASTTAKRVPIDTGSTTPSGSADLVTALPVPCSSLLSTQRICDSIGSERRLTWSKCSLAMLLDKVSNLLRMSTNSTL